MPTIRSPGLDRTALMALRRPHPATEAPPGRIREHPDAHDGYITFSGGKDSVVALHLTLTVEPNVPVVFFDSGLEFPETYRHLEQLHRQFDPGLHWYRARQTTLEVLAGQRDLGPRRHPLPDNPAAARRLDQ